jgi:murein DD-endopeptidase MepM/ murein hydrolase activator NlpD
MLVANLKRVKRPAVLAVLLLLLASASAPALGDDVVHKRVVDTKISSLHSKLAARQQSEAALKNEIDTVTNRIVDLERQVGDVSLRLATIQRDLGLHHRRLGALTRLFKLQSSRLEAIRTQYRLAVERRDRRLVAIYESGKPSALDLVLGARSIDEVLEATNFATLIGKEDRAIAEQVARAKALMQAARRRTAAARATVASEARVIAAREAQERETRDALVGAANSLNAKRQQKVVALSDLSAKDRAVASELDALQAVSSKLADQIRAAQARDAANASSAPASASGLIWPVAGPVTSPFGMRWGRMHEGIDIGAPTGYPIHAAAAGTVIYCGWEEGYGNLVVLDNGGDLSTAYAHQSSIAVGCGQQVNQGDVIGYVGCTGHCYGPHLHFEVRINGTAVDPLSYL